MNATQKKQLEKIRSKIEDLKIEVEAMGEAFREKYDNMTERQQESEKGEALSNEADTLESVSCSLENSVDELDGIIELD